MPTQTKTCTQCNKIFAKPSYHSIKVWNDRKYCSQTCTGLAGIGRPAPKSAYKIGQNIGPKNNQWKGDEANYHSKHDWIARHKVKPPACEGCGKIGNSRKIVWSNVDHLYKRNLDDYKALCGKCHTKHHKEKGLGKYIEQH